MIAVPMIAVPGARARWLALALIGLFAGCGAPPSGDPDILATWDGGQVRVADVEARILAMPATARRPEDGDFATWYEDLVRRIAADRMLAAEGEAAGLGEDDAFEERFAEARRGILAARFTTLDAPPVEPITEADLEAYYRDHPEPFHRPAERRVYQIFRRFRPGQDRSAAMAEVVALRARAVAGEPFPQLAAAHSDSETRHRDGLIGMVTRGQLAPELDALVFSLEKGVPSEPIRTAAGVHLFWVDRVVAEKVFTLEEAGASIIRRLRAERQRDRLAALAGDALPPDAFVPTPEELETLLSAGDAQSLVLRIGTLELRGEDFLARLGARTRARSIEPTLALAVELLEGLVHREQLVLRAVEAGLDQDPQTVDALHDARQHLLADLQLRRRMEQAIESDEAVLRAAFERDANRYSEPLRLRIRLLEVPLSDRPAARMASLEAAGGALERGDTTLEALAAADGGQVTDLGWKSFPALKASRPTLALRAVDLAAGAHTTPFRTSSGLAVGQVVERREPRPMPFEKARERVRDDVLARDRARVLAEVSAALLEAHGFRVDGDALAGLIAGRRGIHGGKGPGASTG